MTITEPRGALWGRSGQKQFWLLSDLLCKLFCCESCTFCHQATLKERHKSLYNSIKISERCFLCRSVVFCPTCQECPQCCSTSASRGQTNQIVKFRSPWGASPQIIRIFKERSTPTRFLELTNFDQVSNDHKWLYVNPLRNSYMMETLHAQNNAVHKSDISITFFSRLFLVQKT